MSTWKRITLLLILTGYFTSCIVGNGDIDVKPSPIVEFTASKTASQTPYSALSSPSPAILPTIPALPNEEAYALLFELLANENCPLPCWLNITPGRSSVLQANSEWAPLFGIADNSDILSRQDGYIDFDYQTQDHDIYIDTNYYLSPSSELIESMSISTRVLRFKEIGSSDRIYVYDFTAYRDLLHAYLLPNILSTYGPPTQILFSMQISSAEPTSPDFFSVWLLYPERGAIVRYEGSADIKEDIIHGCPSDTFVSLWLVNPDNVKLYENTLKDATGHSDIVTGSPYYKSTMEAVGMSAEEFYEVFKDPTERCIESPLDIWPEP